MYVIDNNEYIKSTLKASVLKIDILTNVALITTLLQS